IIGEARIAYRAAKFEPKLVRWVLTKYIVATYGDRGVVNDLFPAWHGVASCRRHFLLFAHHFLLALSVPGHRRRFHRRREDKAVGELRVREPSRTHVVLI